jgi:hypothetical protein
MFAFFAKLGVLCVKFLFIITGRFSKEKPLKTEENIFPRERLIIRHDKLTSETRG